MYKYFLLVVCVAIIFLAKLREENKFIKLCGRSDLKIQKDLLRELNTGTHEIKGCIFEITSSKIILHKVDDIIYSI